MPVRSFRRRPVRGRGQRRKSEWFEANFTQGAVSTTAAHSDLLSPLQTELGASLDAATVVRLVGWVAAERATAGAFGLVDWGIIMDSEDNGPTSHEPTTDNWLDWMAKGRLFLKDRTNNDDDGGAFHRFDLRGKRKQKSVSETLWVACQSPVAPGGTVNFLIHCRGLILLP